MVLRRKIKEWKNNSFFVLKFGCPTLTFESIIVFTDYFKIIKNMENILGYLLFNPVEFVFYLKSLK